MINYNLIYLYSPKFLKENAMEKYLQMKIHPIGYINEKLYFYVENYSRIYEEDLNSIFILINNNINVIKEYIITEYFFFALVNSATDMHIIYNKIYYKSFGNIFFTEDINEKIFKEIKNFFKIFCKLHIITDIDESGVLYVNYLGNILGVRVSFFEGINNSSLISIRFIYNNPFIKTHIPNEFLSNIFSSGIHLIIGKTGSGKTTLLYEILKNLIKYEKTIISIEDPVERFIEGIFQKNISSDSYEDTIKSILRHNPDLIVIGEIRDKNTAAMIFKGVLTGHSFLSTLHVDISNPIENTYKRLKELNVKNFKFIKYIVVVKNKDEINFIKI